MKFVFSFDASQLAGSELKDKDEKFEVKTQRTVPQGSDKTKATEENEQVSKHLSSSLQFLVVHLLNDCFYRVAF